MLYRRDSRNRELDYFVDPKMLKLLRFTDLALRVVHNTGEKKESHCERVIGDFMFRCYPNRLGFCMPKALYPNYERVEILYKGEKVLTRQHCDVVGSINRNLAERLEELMNLPDEVLKSVPK